MAAYEAGSVASAYAALAPALVSALNIVMDGILEKLVEDDDDEIGAERIDQTRAACGG